MIGKRIIFTLVGMAVLITVSGFLLGGVISKQDMAQHDSVKYQSVGL